MKIIDTSSFRILSRYFVPFDRDGVLSGYVHTQIDSGEWIIIEEVKDEFQFAKGLVYDAFPIFDDKDWLNSKTIETELLFASAPSKFFNLVENNWAIQAMKRGLTEAQWEEQKNLFLKSADARILLFALDYQKRNKEEEIYVITEESRSQNDSKFFKKIPLICDQHDIPCKNVIDLIQAEGVIDIQIFNP